MKVLRAQISRYFGSIYHTKYVGKKGHIYLVEHIKIAFLKSPNLIEYILCLCMYDDALF